MNGTTEQIELSLNARGSREDNAPCVGGEEVGLLLNILRGRGWMKSGEIRADGRFVAYYGAELAANSEKAERTIRAVANQSGGQVLSYPGSPGYKLTLEATPKEMEGARVLLNQAKAMKRRYIMLVRLWRGAVKL